MLYPIELRALSELVGVERFELPTPCSQSRCATRLRHTPNKSMGAEGASPKGNAAPQKAPLAHYTGGIRDGQCDVPAHNIWH